MKAVFLDRDGTLIEDRDYLHRPEEIIWIAGAVEALQRLSHGGFELFLVTNQSGVGRGYFSLADLERVHAAMTEHLSAGGVSLRRMYFAPESPDQPSRGRKPSPQFLFDARDEFGVDLKESYLIGDKWCDVVCGRRAGVRGVCLVRTGYGAEVERRHREELGNVRVADDLPAAADWILAQTAF